MDRLRDKLDDAVFKAIDIQVCNDLTGVVGVIEVYQRAGDTDHDSRIVVRTNSGTRAFRVQISEVR